MHCQIPCEPAVTNSSIAISLQCPEPSQEYRLVPVGGAAISLALLCS